MSLLGLIRSFPPYLRSAMVRFPLHSGWEKICSWKQMPFVCLLCNETQSLQSLRNPIKKIQQIKVWRKKLKIYIPGLFLGFKVFFLNISFILLSILRTETAIFQEPNNLQEHYFLILLLRKQLSTKLCETLMKRVTPPKKGHIYLWNTLNPKC